MRKINIALLGFGTVGQAVYSILSEMKEAIAAKTGVELNIVSVVVKDSSKSRKVNCSFCSSNPDDVLSSPDVDVVVEVMGGLKPAKDYVLKALHNKKHVVTANKALLASCMPELVDAADKNGVSIGFEASVAGCIPIIRSLKDALATEQISKIYGIVNGTTNYILTRMAEGSNYKGALFEAQEKGFAEAEPSFDVDAHDAAQKLSVLTAVAFNSFVPGNAIFAEGISRLARDDMIFAKKLGRAIKLLAIARLENGKLQLGVYPTMLPESHPLTSVNYENNALYIVGNNIGQMVLMGRGAGGLPTASAVISNVIDAAKSSGIVSNIKINSAIELQPIEESMFEYYMRFTVIDKPGVLHKISGVLAENNISIGDVMQIGRNQYEPIPLILRTHLTQEKSMNKAVSEIDKLEVIKDKTVVIRMES